MSDRQKGLLAAVHAEFPESCHRYCIRHIYANLAVAGHKGDDLKRKLDAAAYAFDKYDFDIAMDELKKESQAAWEWMCKIPTKHWARHAIDSNCKTDILVNNLSEVFNNYIIRFRDKPIVTMIDGITTKLMARYHTKHEAVEKAKWEITPHYVEKLEWEKKNSRWCEPVCSKRDLWQVKNLERTYVVKLDEKSCSCYKWDVTGLPCMHAVSAIYAANREPEDYVSDFFKKPMYEEAYKSFIHPIPGPHAWTKTNTPDIDPPAYDTKRGRKKKNRRKGANEASKTSKGRMTTITCGNCKLKGHRYTNCTKPLKPHLLIRKSKTKSTRGAPPPARPNQESSSRGAPLPVAPPSYGPAFPSPRSTYAEHLQDQDHQHLKQLTIPKAPLRRQLHSLHQLKRKLTDGMVLLQDWKTIGFIRTSLQV